MVGLCFPALSWGDGSSRSRSRSSSGTTINNNTAVNEHEHHDYYLNCQQQQVNYKDLHRKLQESNDVIRIFGPSQQHTINNNNNSSVQSQTTAVLKPQREKKKEVSFAWYSTAQQRQFLLDHGNECWPNDDMNDMNNNNNNNNNNNEEKEDNHSRNRKNTLTNALAQRFDDFEAAGASFLRVELWKQCVFFTKQGNVFWDPSQVVPMLDWQDLWQFSTPTTALLVEPETTAETHTTITTATSTTTSATSKQAWAHASFMRLEDTSLAESMIRLLVETEMIALTSNPLYTYQSMAQHLQNNDDYSSSSSSSNNTGTSTATSTTLWKAQCQVPSATNPADQVLVQKPKTVKKSRQRQRHRRSLNILEEQSQSQLSTVMFGLHCTIPGGYCCQVWKDERKQQQPPILMVKHPFGTSGGNTSTSPVQWVKTGALSANTDTKELKKKKVYPSKPNPFWSTVTEVSMEDNAPRSKLETPNFFDILLSNNCLPTSPTCHSCLKRYTSTTGCDEQCTNECPCYCKVLCSIRPPPKHVQAVWYVAPPLLQPQTAGPKPQRLIPRIVHQTWYEPLEPDKYPNMSRLQQSWKQSGWTHKFYDDAAAAAFLQEHFPPAVLEAYDAIQPGAFKADLFRYCVLLIQGGVYADMDVLLETNLEEAIEPNVGFITPMDEPGIKVGQQACLWNGFMAVAPGHPFVAKTIELVVNNIRNRFTSVDYDDMLCPNPILSASHLWDILFTTGPCILGTAMNLVLQQHPQTGFKTGEIDIWAANSVSPETELGRSSASPPPRVDHNDPRLAIPGRSIILRQNKEDMGAHRFTLEERNLVICSTDMPDYDDWPKKPHYAESGKQTSLYGTTQLYSDFVSANEEIRVVVVGNPTNFTV